MCVVALAGSLFALPVFVLEHNITSVISRYETFHTSRYDAISKYLFSNLTFCKTISMRSEKLSLYTFTVTVILFLRHCEFAYFTKVRWSAVLRTEYLVVLVVGSRS